MSRQLFLIAVVLTLAGLSSVGSVNGRPPWRSAPAPMAPALMPIPVRHAHATQCYYNAPRARGTAPEEQRPLVWVVDGAGDLKGCSNALSLANVLADNPVELAAFPWSHGHRQLLRDQTDMEHAREQGTRLAAVIRTQQAREPGRRVVIVAHSAGCAVALCAAEQLPPDSIDRLILLAPSVSTGYDIRPALRSAREGVDVYCSKKDWIALGFVTRVVGTTDKYWARAAGRHGFQPGEALNETETARLRQHFWSPDVTWTGHTGGHHGMHTPAFLHAYVFPLIGVSVK